LITSKQTSMIETI